VTLAQLGTVAAVIAPVVLLAGLAARGALWQARTSQRITDLERRLAEDDQDLHDIGTALHDHD
jgi:uncharacterized membrane protein YqjE